MSTESPTEAELFDLACEVYTPDGARLWMRTPNRILGGARPMHLVDRGEGARVAEVLHRIIDGNCS